MVVREPVTQSDRWVMNQTFPENGYLWVGRDEGVVPETGAAPDTCKWSPFESRCMALVRGETKIRRDIHIDLSVERILDRPPLTAWTGSRFSRDELAEAVERLRPKVRQEMDPRAAYTILPTAESGITAYSPPEPLADASLVCTLLVTVGEFDRETPADPTFDELVRDAVENVALQFAKEAVGDRILDQANERGWNTTRLFSPGSGNVDWAIGNSAFVFDTLPADDIGMTRSDTGFIQPPKSISTMIGIGPDVVQAPDIYTCVGCPRLSECDYARTPPGAIADS